MTHSILAILLSLGIFVNGAALEPQTPQAENEIREVRVAVIDTGLRADHPFFKDAKIEKGYNYIEENDNTNDLIGHGTQVCGMVYASAPRAVIVPFVYRSLDKEGRVIDGAEIAIGRAIRDAVDKFSCDVINLSLGAPTDYRMVRDAVEYAERMGAVIVSAVGNDNIILPDMVYYPAAYETVIGVGSVDNRGSVAAFSQRGKSVMFVSRGVNIYLPSISARAGMERVSGTSYSCAWVAGVIAYKFELDGKASPAEVREWLKSVAVDLGKPGYDEDYGWGYLDIELAPAA